MIKKMAIGTVQYGMDYGISNAHGEVQLDVIKQKLDYALSQGVELIDTASAYGSSEQKLGEVGVSQFKVVSKVLELGNVKEAINASLNTLRLSAIYGMLVHQTIRIFDQAEAYDSFEAAKEEGLVEKIGFSINTIEELDKLLEMGFKFDLIQLPYSILDQRFNAYFDELKQAGVEIHTRSTFLQGLFFMNEIPEYLTELTPQIREIQEMTSSSSEIARLAIGFALANKNIDKLVIGANTLKELEENISIFHESSMDDNTNQRLTALASNDEQLVLPMNWKK